LWLAHDEVADAEMATSPAELPDTHLIHEIRLGEAQSGREIGLDGN